MSLDYIRDRYGVPAEMNGRVRFTWPSPAREGVIVGAEGSRLKIRLDGDAGPGYYHPTWELDYFTDDGWKTFDGYATRCDEGSAR